MQQATSAGSYLDGGANHPFQDAAVSLLDPKHAMQATAAIQRVFQEKRRLLIGRLRGMGVVVEHEPAGTFYEWGGLERLPDSLNDGSSFFQAALSEQVITVPGAFFDVNPGRRRTNARYGGYMRLSFGPTLEELEVGLDRLEAMIDHA